MRSPRRSRGAVARRVIGAGATLSGEGSGVATAVGGTAVEVGPVGVAVTAGAALGSIEAGDVLGAFVSGNATGSVGVERHALATHATSASVRVTRRVKARTSPKTGDDDRCSGLDLNVSAVNGKHPGEL